MVTVEENSGKDREINMLEEEKKEIEEMIEKDQSLAALDELKPAAKSSSSIDKQRCSYDIFISFRGEDTRHTFTGYLYDALCQRGFNPFLDDEGLERGEQISSSLLKPTEESKVSIVVFSENYAFSPRCLDELVNILECQKKRGQMVWPIFYKVEPSDVRHQKNRYAEAMAKHEDRFKSEMEKVNRWRSALKDVANLSGWTFKTGYEYKFIMEIIEEASARLHHERLYIGEHIVGLRSRLDEMKSILDIGSRNTIAMVGIHGAGGIGKTTLAKVLYNLIVDQFDNACFLESVRERSSSCMGLVNLQEALLSQIFRKKNFNLGNVDEGANIIKHRLCNRRVLLVLDDVDNEGQLEKLAGAYDWFGLGSRIIITTRDRHVLRAHLVEKTYEMKKLNNDQALELFCWKAFKRNHPDESFVDISDRIIHYAKGLPLALKVIGSNLFGRSLDAWKSALDQYERIPNNDIQGILRVSYDSLEPNPQAIFLDIACFFKGKRLEYVEQISDACDLSAKYSIPVLIDKSLIAIDQVGTLQMHDLIQHMGREVVREKAPSELGKRSRLWYHEDVHRVLIENSGTDKIEGIMLDLPQREEIQWSGTAFEKMNNLRILIVRNASFSTAPKHLPNNLRLLDWDEYPSEFLPQGFYTRKVVVLKLCANRLKLAKPFQKFEKLSHIDFSSSQLITQIPDMSGVPNITELILSNCKSLIKVDNSVAFLTKLVELKLEGCTNLKKFPQEIQMTSLKFLNFDGCTRLQYFPEIMGEMNDLREIFGNRTAIKQLPHSIGLLKGLKRLYLADNNHLVSLPETIKRLDGLDELLVKNCQKLREIPGIPPNLQIINAENCSSLSSHSVNVIWLQALNEVEDLTVKMPRTPIPDWFDHRCKGGILSFRTRGKLPHVAFAVVLSKSRNVKSSAGGTVCVECYNDGRKVSDKHHTSNNNEGCVFLMKLDNDVTKFRNLDWNYVEIKCRSLSSNYKIDECGVYVYKQDINMEDIQFEESKNDTELEMDESIEKNDQAKSKKRFQQLAYISLVFLCIFIACFIVVLRRGH